MTEEQKTKKTHIVNSEFAQIVHIQEGDKVVCKGKLGVIRSIYRNSQGLHAIWSPITENGEMLEAFFIIPENEFSNFSTKTT